MNPFNFISPSSSITAPVPPTKDPLKLFMEDIEIQSLSGKCVKIQAYIGMFKEEKNAMKNLNYPIAKQCLDDAIKALEVEHDKILAEMKDRLNRTGITDVNVSPEEMIKVFQNLSLTSTNTKQPEPTQMQQGLGKQESMGMQQQQRLLQMLHQQQHQQSLLQRQQGLGQLPF